MTKSLAGALLVGTMLAGLSAPAFAADLTPVHQPTAASMYDITFIAGASAGYLFAGPAYDDPSGVYDAPVLGAFASTNVWVSEAHAFQLDAKVDVLFHDDEITEGGVYTEFGFAGHLAWRDPERYALGVFASAGMQPWFNSFATVGVEGQHYMGNTTLYGQIGFTNGIGGGASDYDASGLYVFGEVRHFAKPNLMYSVHLAGDFIGSSDDEGDVTGIRWGAGVEYQREGTPWVHFLRYRGSHHSKPAEDSYLGDPGTDHELSVGFKVMWGQPSLLYNDRYGATFADQNPFTGAYSLRTDIHD